MLDVFDPKSELNRDRIKEKVVAVARNSEYTNPGGEWLLDKDSRKVWVEKENIKITKIESNGKAAHIANPSDRRDKDQEILIGIRPVDWNINLTREGQICVISHELNHIGHPHHKPRFWELHTRNLLKLYERRDALFDIWFDEFTRRSDFNWNNAIERLLNSVQETTVDFRCVDSVEEQQEKVIEQIQWHFLINQKITEVRNEIDESDVRQFDVF